MKERPNYFMAAKSWLLWKDSPFSMKARAAGLVITNHMWDRPEWELSMKLIALEAGTSERTAWAGVAELETAGFLAVQSGSMAGAKRANTYTLLPPFTSIRTEGDLRNSCESRERRPSQKVGRRKVRPSQNVGATSATVANSILLQSSTDSILNDSGGQAAPFQAIDLDRLTQRVATSHSLYAFPGARRA